MILTVEKLIEVLSKFPPNAVPYIHDDGKDCGVLIESISEDFNAPYFRGDESDFLEEDETLIHFIKIKTYI